MHDSCSVVTLPKSPIAMTSMSALGQPFLPDGVINIRKPAGWTSHDVVMYLRRFFGIPKIGHGGTLDPAATGVLPVLIGKGTKLAPYLLEWEKEYAAVLRLGQTTDTQDATGTILHETHNLNVSTEDILKVVSQFQGVIRQIPPMFSAKKVAGQPLYKAARKGQVIERQARSVRIHQLEVVAIRAEEIHLRVVCSKGTYMRTLCADIGERLGVGGHLSQLERVRVGPFHIRQALDLEAMKKKQWDEQWQAAFMDMDEVLGDIPVAAVSDVYCQRILHGTPVPCVAVRFEPGRGSGDLSRGQLVRIKDERGSLLALGQIQRVGLPSRDEASVVAVKKLLVERETVHG